MRQVLDRCEYQVLEVREQCQIEKKTSQGLDCEHVPVISISRVFAEID